MIKLLLVALVSPRAALVLSALLIMVLVLALWFRGR